jgi:hypothetical protein
MFAPAGRAPTPECSKVGILTTLRPIPNSPTRACRPSNGQTLLSPPCPMAASGTYFVASTQVNCSTGWGDPGAGCHHRRLRHRPLREVRGRHALLRDCGSHVFGRDAAPLVFRVWVKLGLSWPAGAPPCLTTTDRNTPGFTRPVARPGLTSWGRPSRRDGAWRPAGAAERRAARPRRRGLPGDYFRGAICRSETNSV